VRLRFLPAAEAETVREVSHYATHGRPGTAARFQSAVESAAKMALRHPLGGAPSFKETRAFKVNGFPFPLVYRASASEVLVVAVAPTSRQENYWAGRVE
jgi:plasmid stabilization system protein ParE